MQELSQIGPKEKSEKIALHFHFQEKIVYPTVEGDSPEKTLSLKMKAFVIKVEIMNFLYALIRVKNY